MGAEFRSIRIPQAASTIGSPSKCGICGLRSAGMKTCSKCRVEKDESEFSKRVARKDGLQAYCKPCANKNIGQWLKANPEKARARVDRWKSINKAHVIEHDRQRRAANPEKCIARRRVRSAILDGRLVRQPCEVCGALRTHGHHEDYSKPLDVVWLCPTHHAARHAMIG